MNLHYRHTFGTKNSELCKIGCLELFEGHTSILWDPATTINNGQFARTQRDVAMGTELEGRARSRSYRHKHTPSVISDKRNNKRKCTYQINYRVKSLRTINHQKHMWFFPQSPAHSPDPNPSKHLWDNLEC